MSDALQGSCLCGAVRIELSGKPYRVGICHCLDCRKKSGGIFASWAIYPVDQVKVTGKTASHKLRNDYERHFCPWLPPLPLARHYTRNRKGGGRSEP
jgi:hypothetical protein